MATILSCSFASYFETTSIKYGRNRYQYIRIKCASYGSAEYIGRATPLILAGCAIFNSHSYIYTKIHCIYYTDTSIAMQTSSIVDWLNGKMNSSVAIWSKEVQLFARFFSVFTQKLNGIFWKIMILKWLIWLWLRYAQLLRILFQNMSNFQVLPMQRNQKLFW